MNIIRNTTTFGLATLIMTTLTVGSANADHANVVKVLNSHAYNLERLADRADRDMRYYFKTAPQNMCLREQFCFIEEKADDIQRGLRTRLDARDLEECLEELDDAFSLVQKHMLSLRKWSKSCQPQTIRYSSSRLTVCSNPGVNEIYMQRLCSRVEDIGRTLGCMITEVDGLLDGQRGHQHSHGGSNRIVPAPAPRPQLVFPQRRPVIQQPPVYRQAHHRSPALGRTRITVPIGKHNNSRLYFSFSF